jgi:hypothetical protein
LYLVLAGSVGRAELLTGAAVTALVSLSGFAVRRCSPYRFLATPEHLGRWLRALFEVLPASGAVAWQLLRVLLGAKPASRARVCAFDYGPVENACERARRAGALVSASLAPSRFVVRLRADRGQALLHELASGDREPDRRWLS